MLKDVSTYSLAGWHLPRFCLGPLLCGGGDISTTSGDGGGISTTSGDDNTMTSSSLQKSKKQSVNTIHTSLQFKTQKQPVYYNYTSQTC